MGGGHGRRGNRGAGPDRDAIAARRGAGAGGDAAVTERIMLRWSVLPAAGDSGTARGPDDASGPGGVSGPDDAHAPGGELASAMAAHGETIAAEVLAVSLERMPSPGAAVPLAGHGTPGQWSEHGDPDLGLRFWIRRQA